MNCSQLLDPWLAARRKQRAGNMHCSRLYPPASSRTRAHAWWFQIPPPNLDEFPFVELFAATRADPADFHHLIVPTPFLRRHWAEFGRLKENASLFLSAEPEGLFRDAHPDGAGVDFISFVQARARTYSA